MGRRVVFVLALLAIMVGGLLAVPAKAQSEGLVERYWAPPSIVRDQGSRPTCVAQAWANLLESEPYASYAPDTESLYHYAQTLDPWPGEDYDGTSVQAGAQALINWQMLQGVDYTQDVDTAAWWIETNGPIVVGVGFPWKAQFPDEQGYIGVSGPILAGHAFECYGYSSVSDGMHKHEGFECMNSWGERFGAHGVFWVHTWDMKYLMRDNGWAEGDIMLPEKGYVVTNSGHMAAWAMPVS